MNRHEASPFSFSENFSASRLRRWHWPSQASAPRRRTKTEASRASQKSKVSKDGERITIEELDQVTYGFADRYMAYIVSACDQISGETINTWRQLGLDGEWADLDIAPKGPAKTHAAALLGWKISPVAILIYIREQKTRRRPIALGRTFAWLYLF